MDTSSNGLDRHLRNMGLRQLVWKFPSPLHLHTPPITFPNLLDWVDPSMVYILWECILWKVARCWFLDSHVPCWCGTAAHWDFHDELVDFLLASHDHAGCCYWYWWGYYLCAFVGVGGDVF